MAEIKNILIVCGEPSGDILAAKLLAGIQRLAGGVKFCGVGGDQLAKAGAKIFYDIKDLSVMGLFDVLKKLPRFLKLKKLVLQQIKARKPDCLILVDFSGFNLRLAKAVNRQLPVIYYVSPQIWASREKRIELIKKYVSKLVVLFKFEEEFYRKHGIQADYAGHPLIDSTPATLNSSAVIQELGLDPQKWIIGLLPGSRKQEIKLILPLMLKTAQLVNRIAPQTQFIIAKSPNLDLKLYQRICRKFNLNIKIIEARTLDCLNAAQASLICSGTATLEAAIVGKPFLIIYKANLLNYLLYRPQIKIPCIGIVNIMAGQKIIPEFLQFQAQPRKIAGALIDLLKDPLASQTMRQNLIGIRAALGEPKAADRAAKFILDYLQNQ